MTKSGLINNIAIKQSQLSSKDVELAVKSILEYMSQFLSEGGRIEIRGFGSFSLHYRVPRIGRNPKTGTPVALSGKYVPHFKPGKELRDRYSTYPLAQQFVSLYLTVGHAKSTLAKDGAFAAAFSSSAKWLRVVE